VSSSPPTRRRTIRDVAAAAGVSPTTVSHALNDKGHVDPATRERVVAVASELGYRPSRAARALRSGRTGVIALLLPELDAADDEQPALGRDYYMRVTASAARTAFAGHHPLLLTPSPESPAALDQLAVDGAIVVDPSHRDPRVGLLLGAGLPVVSIERDPGRPEHRSYVHGDNRRATRELLDHLRDAGAQRIAMLSLDEDWAWATDSEEAYRSWSAEHGRTATVVRTDLRGSGRTAEERTRELLGGPDPPDAVFALAEGWATAALRAARGRGLAVPEDLLIASGTDSADARAADPPITSIDLQPDRQGAAAATLLVGLLEGREPADPVALPTALLRRASTRGLRR
jgi:DNA-binding LacI/PurR family transcriptional regulator